MMYFSKIHVHYYKFTVRVFDLIVNCLSDCNILLSSFSFCDCCDTTKVGIYFYVVQYFDM